MQFKKITNNMVYLRMAIKCHLAVLINIFSKNLKKTKIFFNIS